MSALLLVFFVIVPLISGQQTDDPYYFMNRGMMMMGQGLTEILTNQKFEGDYLSGVMEPHDMPNHMVQQDWYKNYYGKDARMTDQTAQGQQSQQQYSNHYQGQNYGQNQQQQYNNNNYNGTAILITEPKQKESP